MRTIDRTVATLNPSSVFPACGGVAIFKVLLPTEATLKIMLSTGLRVFGTFFLGSISRGLGLLLCGKLSTKVGSGQEQGHLFVRVTSSFFPPFLALACVVLQQYKTSRAGFQNGQNGVLEMNLALINDSRSARAGLTCTRPTTIGGAISSHSVY